MNLQTLLSGETSTVLKILLMKKKKYHTNYIFRSRTRFGEYHTLFPQLLEQPAKFFEYMRMDKETFYYILEGIREKIQKQSNFRRCISPEERLIVTLRYVLSNFTE